MDGQKSVKKFKRKLWMPPIVFHFNIWEPQKQDILGVKCIVLADFVKKKQNECIFIFKSETQMRKR